MSIAKLCVRNVATAGKDFTLGEAAKVMREHHVGDVIVTEERAGGKVPIGILTDRDIVLTALANGSNPEKLLVRDVMSYDLVTGMEDDGIFETIRLMKKNGIRRLPVVDAKGFLAGIISVDDLLEMLVTELSTLAQVTDRQFQRERELRP